MLCTLSRTSGRARHVWLGVNGPAGFAPVNQRFPVALAQQDPGAPLASQDAWHWNKGIVGVGTSPSQEPGPQRQQTGGCHHRHPGHFQTPLCCSLGPEPILINPGNQSIGWRALNTQAPTLCLDIPLVLECLLQEDGGRETQENTAQDPRSAGPLSQELRRASDCGIRGYAGYSRVFAVSRVTAGEVSFQRKAFQTPHCRHRLADVPPLLLLMLRSQTTELWPQRTSDSHCVA